MRFSPFLIILSRSFVAYYNQVNDDSQFKPWFNFFLIRCFFFLNGYVEYKLALRIQTNYNIYFVCFVQVLLFVFSLSEREERKGKELKFRLKLLLVLAPGRSLNPSALPAVTKERVKIQSLYPCPAPQGCHLLYRAYSLSWPASMQIYGNKRNFLHKERVQLLQSLFGTPIWPLWSHVNMLCGVPWDLWCHSKWPPSCAAKKF